MAPTPPGARRAPVPFPLPTPPSTHACRPSAHVREPNSAAESAAREWQGQEKDPWNKVLDIPNTDPHPDWYELCKHSNRDELIKELIKFLPHEIRLKEIKAKSQANNFQNPASEMLILSKEAIAQLPDELQQQLKQAIVSVDIESIELLLEQISE